MACHWDGCIEMTDREMIKSPIILVLGLKLLIINDDYTTYRHLIDMHWDTDLVFQCKSAKSMNQSIWSDKIYIKMFWTDISAYSWWIHSVICWCVVTVLRRPLSKMMIGVTAPEIFIDVWHILYYMYVFGTVAEPLAFCMIVHF